ncbi:tRNA-binding protein [Actinopolyspora xinjiangensis]|uniref:tRNA-binding protein n=1 Tax=Actinopolyspora xinjiangensis TaxID=405564 RepID=A0A1H0RF10_9ACTN|nr:tRNA-binding protein [Actinopolyspora xinjiangensis]SDP27759.1 tRNA-binding protein [Actinopolyspora xinjiangensis]
MADFEGFRRFDIRVGRIARVEPHDRARTPAYKMWIDFGPELGTRTSSAQLCDNYTAEELPGNQVVCIVNLPPRRVAGFDSEVLVLASVSAEEGTVLLQPGQEVTPGARIA